MIDDDRVRLAAEKTALERMIARTPASEVIDRASLTARLRNVNDELAAILASANAAELITELVGTLQGVLPGARAFEFCVSATGQVVSGAIGPGVTNPSALNALLERPLTIKVAVTTRSGRAPRYTLLEMPQ